MIRRLFRLLLLCVGLGPAMAPAFALPDTTAAERGAYLAKVGNCAGCHTAPGGDDYAGGLRLASDYGTFVTPNITPEPATGIGDWNADQFYRALHEGRRADGSPMYPACPYHAYTHVERADIDALYAYLQTVVPVERRQPDHDLVFPYRYRSLLHVWQWLYFQPGELSPVADRSPAWQRGRYLVEGLGHCDACHVERSWLGAENEDAEAPGAIVHGWYAPSLDDPDQAGLQAHTITEAATLLTTGKQDSAATLGPMAGVVFESLQYLTDADARAMATYLVERESVEADDPRRLIGMSTGRRDRMMAEGRSIYDERCSDCHGDDGRGSDRGPALAGNRGVTMTSPLNAARMIHAGGYPPATAGNPRPFGMPPFYALSDTELASVLSYIRRSWGNDAPAVTTKNLTP